MEHFKLSNGIYINPDHVTLSRIKNMDFDNDYDLLIKIISGPDIIIKHKSKNAAEGELLSLHEHIRKQNDTNYRAWMSLKKD